jgi:hypothetical protein
MEMSAPAHLRTRLDDWGGRQAAGCRLRRTSGSGIAARAAVRPAWVECSPSFNPSKPLCKGTGFLPRKSHWVSQCRIRLNGQRRRRLLVIVFQFRCDLGLLRRRTGSCAASGIANAQRSRGLSFAPLAMSDKGVWCKSRFPGFSELVASLISLTNFGADYARKRTLHQSHRHRSSSTAPQRSVQCQRRRQDAACVGSVAFSHHASPQATRRHQPVSSRCCPAIGAQVRSLSVVAGIPAASLPDDRGSCDRGWRARGQTGG